MCLHVGSLHLSEVKKKTEEHFSPNDVMYEELEIISSDEEERERILLRSRRVIRKRQTRRK